MKRTPPLFGQIFFGMSLLLFLLSIGFVYINRSQIFGLNSNSDSSSSETVEINDDQADVNEPEQNEDEDAESSDEDVANLDSDDPASEEEKPEEEGDQAVTTEAEEISVTITRASIEDEVLILRTTLNTTLPGTCTVDVELSDGTTFISDSVETQIIGGTSTCQGFDIPFTDFGAVDGVSNIEVFYEAEDGQTASSGVQGFEIFTQ